MAYYIRIKGNKPKKKNKRKTMSYPNQQQINSNQNLFSNNAPIGTSMPSFQRPQKDYSKMFPKKDYSKMLKESKQKDKYRAYQLQKRKDQVEELKQGARTSSSWLKKASGYVKSKTTSKLTGKRPKSIYN